MNLEEHILKTGLSIFFGKLPEELVLPVASFEELWALHPAAFPRASFAGVERQLPRWHQAYERDYNFAGLASQALPLPPMLAPLVCWAQCTVHPALNGLLVNWYDGDLEHRIAAHKDAPLGRVRGCPIVSISLGAQRTLYMHVGKRVQRFPLTAGTVLVLPDATNARIAHSVPHLPGDGGRRISLTLRAFAP